MMPYPNGSQEVSIQGGISSGSWAPRDSLSVQLNRYNQIVRIEGLFAWEVADLTQTYQIHVYRRSIFRTRAHLDSRGLYDSPVSILGDIVGWSWSVPVDEGKRGIVVGTSPLHPDEVGGQQGEPSLANYHYRLGVGIGVMTHSKGEDTQD